jgi:CheY-like chemotaxis protein
MKKTVYRILIIENRQGQRKLIEDYLKSLRILEKLDIVWFETLKALEEKLREHSSVGWFVQFQLIVADLYLETGEPVTTVRVLEELLGRGYNHPIIFMSADQSYIRALQANPKIGAHYCFVLDVPRKIGELLQIKTYSP